MIARLLAWSANFSARWNLPVPLTLQLLTEAWLWNHPDQIKVFLNHVNPAALWRLGEKKMLALVRRFARTTPALADLAAAHFPDGLKSIDDFKARMPVIDKASYIKPRRLTELCQGGRIPRAGSLYKSAGTTGQPTIWTDSVREQLAFDKSVGFIGHTLLDMVTRDYIIVNCWVMGSWLTGGNFASSARFYGNIINIGTLLNEAVETVRAIGPERPFLIAGYPPFVYSLLKKLEDGGCDFSQYRFDVVVGGEGFVEEWRDALIRRLGRDRAVFSVYGSSDKGLGEGIETHLAYGFRTLLYVASLTLVDPVQAAAAWRLRSGESAPPFTAATARAFLEALLGPDGIQRTPMVFQFDPTIYYNENLPPSPGGPGRREFASTVLLPWMTIPRVRYNIHDEGFVVTYDEARRAVEAAGVPWEKLNLRGDPYFDLHLPFLFIFGRTDGTVSIDGANIFPQDVDRCLREDPFLSDWVYGFQLFVTPFYNLGIALELRAGAPENPEHLERARQWLDERLAKYSAGYAELRRDQLPSAVLTVEKHPHATGPFANRRVKTPSVRNSPNPG